jgi:hypothetical protein
MFAAILLRKRHPGREAGPQSPGSRLENLRSPGLPKRSVAGTFAGRLSIQGVIQMKKLVSISVAALVLAACSEATGPNADLAARSAKPVTDPGFTVSGALTNQSFDFEDGGFEVAGGPFFAVNDLESGGFSASAPNIVSAWNGSTDFIGRVDNHSILLALPPEAAGSVYSLAFDLYIIGSWDGQGKQAQQGAFGQDIWRLSIRCGSLSAAPETILLETDFSNQHTVQQSYPLSASKTGGKKAGNGSYAIDALGFVNDPSVHTPQFRSYGDASYHMEFAGSNPCAAGQMLVFAFVVPDAGLQSNYDESWGLDNVVIKTD